MDSENEKTGLVDNYLPENVQEQLKGIFKDMPNTISIYLFKDAGSEDQEIKVGRELIQAFQALTDKIEFTEYDLSHEMAEKWDVQSTPTLVFSPDKYSIQYKGIPLGEEGRTLVEILVLLGLGQSQLTEQAAKILDKIDDNRDVLVFVSPTCPYCPQQAINAVNAVLRNPDHISLKIVDTSFNSEMAEQYSAYSVPQTYANEFLIAKGAQPPELFAASLESLAEEQYFIPESDAEHIEADVVIIGGGPAGLTAGIYASRSGLDTIVLERDTLGGQVATTPIVENYPGISHIGGKNLVDIMVTHALEYVNILSKESVMEIKVEDSIEIVTTARRLTAKALVIATGAKYKTLGAIGESEFSGRGVSYCSTCDGPLFKEKDVLMVGGGNSAVTEALHLAHMGVNVTLVHRRDSLRAQEHLIRDLEANNIPVMWNSEIKKIKGVQKVEQVEIYNNKSGETTTIPVQGVFVSIGYTPETELAAKVGAKLTEDGFIAHDGQHRTNIRGVYCAGDVEGGYKQIVTATAAGAGAAMTIFEDLTNPYWTDKEKA